MSDPLEARLADILRASPTLTRVLAVARDLGAPQWRIASGAVYQTAWNALTGRPADYGIKDYDLIYFDGSDLSYEAEDIVIRRAAAMFPPDLTERVEARNQARVHLWFERHFGEPYAPLTSADEALGRFIAPAFAVGARLEPDGRLDIAAPFGLEDLFALRLRPNPTQPLSRNWTKAASSVKARWPEATVEAPAGAAGRR